MNGRWVLPGAVLVVVIAAVLAFALGGRSPSASPSASAVTSPSSSVSAAPTDASSLPPSASGTAAPAGPTTIVGTLPRYAGPNGDTAIGRPVPVVHGSSFDGSAVSIEPTGRPQMILFVAHWCPHCQREVPLLQAWLDAKGPPDGIDLRSVATGIDPTLPNYPPDAWLAREHWSVPVLVDGDDRIASAFGLSAYPYWVFVDAQGNIALRATGELTIANVEAVLAALRGN